MDDSLSPDPAEPEPRWYALIAVLAASGLHVALPASLTSGPRWLFPAVIVALLIPTMAFHRGGRHRLDRMFGFALNGAITIEMIASVVLLVRALPSRQESPTELLLSAASLWTINVLVFALWYWRLDSGGPHAREARRRHAEGAFLFPQMMPLAGGAPREDGWSPNFVDYLFLAFNTSTAFSPTDTAPLARWAKLLMMIQSVIALTVLAVLAARAVNIL
jgi:hypothetical protein